MGDAQTSAPIFDKAGAFERVDNDLELYRELVEMFFSEYPDMCSAIEIALNSNMGKQLEERAHSLKSALGNLGAMKSYEYSKTLEYAGRRGAFDEARSVWPQLQESIFQFRELAEAL